MTEKAFVNALTVDMALGCSTNSMLHLPAIAREAGVALNVDIANGISAKTPNLCHLAPAGHTYMEQLNEAGGVYAVMNELSKKNLLNLECTANCISQFVDILYDEIMLCDRHCNTSDIDLLEGISSQK